MVASVNAVSGLDYEGLNNRVHHAAMQDLKGQPSVPLMMEAKEATLFIKHTAWFGPGSCLGNH